MEKYLADPMIKNAHEEAHYFKQLLENKEQITKSFVRLFKENEIRRIYISAHGSPSFAAIAIKYLFVTLLEIDSSRDVATTFNNHEGFKSSHKPENILLVCPAATGNTKGPIIAARNAKKMGIHVLGSANEPNERFVKECDVFIDKLTCKENAHVDVKGHGATLFLYAMCIVETAYVLNKIDRSAYDQYQKGLEKIIEDHDALFQQSLEWYGENKDKLLEAKLIKIISSGINYATAAEGALKISESSQRQAIGYDLEQFLHGPNLSSNVNDFFFFINHYKGVEFERTNQTYELMKSKGYVRSILVTSPANHSVRQGDHSFVFDFVELELLSFIQFITLFQVIAGRMALDLWLDTTKEPEPFASITSILETSFRN
jgi:glucoselysine-6-phosphate deglycase